MNKNLINDSYLFVQVVDGVWWMKYHELDDGTVLIITDEIVTGGNSLSGWIYNKEGKINDYPITSIIDFDSFEGYLKKDCSLESEWEENTIYHFDYLIDHKKSNDLYFHDYYAKNTKECYKGNTIIFEFDKALKKYSFKEVIWEDINY